MKNKLQNHLNTTGFKHQVSWSKCLFILQNFLHDQTIANGRANCVIE
jgi:hypothetical protein